MYSMHCSKETLVVADVRNIYMPYNKMSLLVHISICQCSGTSLDTEYLLSQGNRPEGGIKVKETNMRIYSQKGSHVSVIGQSSRKANHANNLLRHLHLPKCPSNNAFQN